MRYSIIGAMAKNGIVGNNGVMPWKSKEEMNYFKSVTLNKPVIMGRKTWDSLYTKPLKNRYNVVITRNRELLDLQIDPENGNDAHFVSSLEEAMDLVQDMNIEAFIIGGVEIWKYALDQDYIDKIYLNVFKKDYEGDCHFPFYDKTKFILDNTNTQKYQDFDNYIFFKKLQVEEVNPI